MSFMSLTTLSLFLTLVCISDTVVINILLQTNLNSIITSAHVSLKNEVKSITKEALPNENGYYSTNIEPSTYTVSILSREYENITDVIHVNQLKKRFTFILSKAKESQVIDVVNTPINQVNISKVLTKRTNKKCRPRPNSSNFTRYNYFLLLVLPLLFII